MVSLRRGVAPLSPPLCIPVSPLAVVSPGWCARSTTPALHRLAVLFPRWPALWLSGRLWQAGVVLTLLTLKPCPHSAWRPWTNQPSKRRHVVLARVSHACGDDTHAPGRGDYCLPDKDNSGVLTPLGPGAGCSAFPRVQLLVVIRGGQVKGQAVAGAWDGRLRRWLGQVQERGGAGRGGVVLVGREGMSGGGRDDEKILVGWGVREGAIALCACAPLPVWHQRAE